MSEFLIQESTLIEIADAVRTKTNASNNILVSDLPSKILSIPSGGSEWLLMDNAPKGTSNGVSGPMITITESGPIGFITYDIKQKSTGYFIFLSDQMKMDFETLQSKTHNGYIILANSDTSFTVICSNYNYDKSTYYLPIYSYN